MTRAGSGRYRQVTFRELDEDSDRSPGAARVGVGPGTRLALLVRPGSRFHLAGVRACSRPGVVVILIDPGMGRRNLIRCLAEAEPDGFVAIPSSTQADARLRGGFPRPVST